MSESGRSLYIGLVLLGLAIVMHILLIQYLGASGYPLLLNTSRLYRDYRDLCSSIEAFDRCSGYLIYIWALSRLPDILALLPQVLVVILIYLSSYVMFRNHLVSGLLSLLYSTAPGSMLVYSIDQSGLIYVSSLAVIPLLLIMSSFVSTRLLLLLGCILYIALIYLPITPIVLMTYSLTTIFGVKRENSKIHALALIVLSTLTSLFIYVNGVSYYGVYALPALVLGYAVGLSLLFYGAVFLESGYKSLFTLLLLLLATISGLLTQYIGGFASISFRGFNILILYGVLGVLAVASFIYIFTRRVSMAVILVAINALSLVLVSSIDQCVYPLALAGLGVLSGVVVDTLVRYLSKLYATPRSLHRVLSTGTLMVLIIVASLVNPILLARTMSIGLVDSELLELSKAGVFTARQPDLYSALREFANAIKERSKGGSALVVAHWEYSYIILNTAGENGVHARLVTHAHGGSAGKALLSSIMVSHWDSSRRLLVNLSSELGVQDVYVLVAFAYSVSGNYSYLGLPVTLNLPGQQYPQLAFEAFGDTYRLLDYLSHAGRSMGNYVFMPPEGSRIVLPTRVTALTWKTTTEELLINQLVVKTLEAKGYSRIYLQEGMAVSSSVSGFELVKYIDWVGGVITAGYYGDFEVHYSIALFRLVG